MGEAGRPQPASSHRSLQLALPPWQQAPASSSWMWGEVGREAESSAQAAVLGAASPCPPPASTRPQLGLLGAASKDRHVAAVPCPPPTQTPHTTHTMVQTHHTSRWSRAGPSASFA